MVNHRIKLVAFISAVTVAVLSQSATAQVDPNQNAADLISVADSLEADSLLGQPTVHALALPAASRIVLRWTPSGPGAWLLARKVGYKIERAELGAPGEPLEYVSLSDEPIMPWPLERYTQPAVEANNLLGVVGQAVHGEYFESGVSTASVNSLLRAAKESRSRFQYSQLAADLDSTAAEALGVRFVDPTVVEGTEYLYRVFVAGVDSVVQVDTAAVVVRAYNPGPIAGVLGLAAEPGDSTIAVSWEKDPAQRFSAYWIERSSDGGRTFERITEGPYFGTIGSDARRVMFQDKGVANYRIYKYRVTGITFFGTLSQAETVDVMAVDFEAPPPPFITETEHLEESRVRIKWEIIADEMPDDFKGFYIGHSIDHGGDYALDLTTLYPRETREAIDERAIATRANYYVVVAVDTSDNVSASLPMLAQLLDSIPPPPPANFRVVSIADTTGRIEIAWKTPDAEDLYAYRVYRKHNINDEWVLRHSDLHFDSTFVDTLNFKSLTNEVYYQVVAIDYSFNPSDASVPFRVPLPDLLPPVAPVFTEAVPTDSSVSLAWSRSPSFDVVEQILYRRLSTEALWGEHQILDAVAASFVDFDVQKLRTYEYTIQAADSSGFRSNLAVPVKGRVYDTGIRPGITRLAAAADTTSGYVQLSWSYPNPDDGEYWFVVYRGLADEEPARYRSAGAETEFYDRRIRFREEEGYRYAVQVMYRNGGMSPLSSVVSVGYPRQ